MVLKKKIKFLNLKESVLIIILIAPLFIILAIPVLLVFFFRAIFKIFSPRKHEEQIDRETPYF